MRTFLLATLVLLLLRRKPQPFVRIDTPLFV